MTRKLLSVAAVGAALALAAAAPAVAQTVTFSTSGTFNIGGSCSMSACNFGSFVLTYSGLGSATYGAGEQGLGHFTASCDNCTGGEQQTIVSPGSVFNLTITQTNPGPTSNGTFSGQISGTLAYDPSSSSLIWTPSATSLVINGVTYNLILDNKGPFIAISGPNTAEGGNPMNTSVKALVTVTPEPASLALMATGLIGLVPVVRRRRNS